jgi:hypothetical protein
VDFALMFDRQYSQAGLLCLASLLERSVRVFVLCLEDTIGAAVVKLGGTPVDRADLEEAYPHIAATLQRGRPWAPYTQSLKPFLIEHLLLKHQVQAVTYVDSDMYFWGDPREIDIEFAGHSFMVTPSSSRPEVCFFDGGCFACRNDSHGKDFLVWWQGKCVDWCLWEEGPNGAFCEEGYLNIIRTDPLRFQGTHVCEHPGINLAPWKLRGQDIQSSETGFSVNGRPLVCYHYQGYTKHSEEFIAPATLDSGVAELLYRPYHERLPQG